MALQPPAECFRNRGDWTRDSRVAGRHGLTGVPGAELGDGAVLQVDQIEERRRCGTDGQRDTGGQWELGT